MHILKTLLRGRELLSAFSAIFLCSHFVQGNCIGPSKPLVKKTFVTILDEGGKPTAAKVRITARDSVYYAPDGHHVDFPFTNFGGDVILDNGRRFAYVDRTFTIDLPQGENIRFEAVKGFAYRLFDRTIKISDGTDSVSIQLEKWFGFPKGKWFSGDVHVHNIDPATALTEMKAEDLNVCNVLTSDFTTDQDRFRGSPEPLSDSLHLIYINQEYRENRLGHVNLLNLKKLINVKPIREFQYPLNMAALDQAHAQGGHVSWAHFAAWPGLEGPLAIVMKKVDAVELLSTVDPFTQPVFVTDIIPDLRMNSGLKIWYRLLNCGLKLPATAGTDKMTNWVTVGANRVYARIKGDFTYQAWIDALNKGSTFITNSPLLFCSVAGEDPGEVINLSKQQTVKIVAEVWSQFPLNRLEIIANGEVIAERIIEKGQSHATLELEFKPAKSAWIAARAHQYNEDDMDDGVSFVQRRDFGGGPTLLNNYYGTLRPETAFAHTSPTYVIVDRQPIHSGPDAEYFVKYLENGISWLQKSGRFPSEQAKQEVLDAFRKGQDMFKKLSK